MPDSREQELGRLERLLDAYGADPARWPEADREWALRLTGESADARALRAAAARLDALLDAAPAPQPSLELMADALAGANLPRHRRWAAALWPFGPVWQPATALAAAGALGLLVGLVAPVTTPFADTDGGTEIAALADGTTFELDDDE